MSNLTDEEQARFDSKWTPRGDCHVWTGPLDRDGYGSFYLRRRNRRANRVAWFATNGPIPSDRVVGHSCRNRACVNVQHLRLVTPYENTMLDSSSLGYINSRKVTCRRGHAFDGVYVNRRTGKQQRICSICDRAKKARLRAKWIAEDTLAV